MGMTFCLIHHEMAVKKAAKRRVRGRSTMASAPTTLASVRIVFQCNAAMSVKIWCSMLERDVLIEKVRLGAGRGLTGGRSTRGAAADRAAGGC